MSDINKHFGKLMKQGRHNKCWVTQQEVADKAKISRAMVSNFECGRCDIDLKAAKAIAEVLGISIDRMELLK